MLQLYIYIGIHLSGKQNAFQNCSEKIIRQRKTTATQRKRDTTDGHQNQFSIFYASYLSSKFCGSCDVLRNRILGMVTLKLAQVALFLDKLDVVVLAVESSLVRNIVRRADRTPSMAALETALVVRSPIYRHLSIQQYQQNQPSCFYKLNRMTCVSFYVAETGQYLVFYLFSWIDSILAAKAFISGSPKHTCDFSHCRFLFNKKFISED